MAMNFTPVPHEFLEEMEALKDGEYGRLVRWAQRYLIAGEDGELTGNERFYKNRFRMQIERYRAHYQEISEQRRAAGRKGAETANARRQTAANAGNGRETKTETETKTKTKTETDLLQKEREERARRAAEGGDWAWLRDEYGFPDFLRSDTDGGLTRVGAPFGEK